MEFYSVNYKLRACEYARRAWVNPHEPIVTLRLDIIKIFSVASSI
jgi:hypothetical protein